jgi:hypothetical protein
VLYRLASTLRTSDPSTQGKYGKTLKFFHSIHFEQGQVRMTWAHCKDENDKLSEKCNRFHRHRPKENKVGLKNHQLTCMKKTWL